MTLEDLSTTLQLATSPAILISACGLLLLSMTNRLGRAIDRSRSLYADWSKDHSSHHQSLEEQLKILSRRSRLIRLAILWTTLCIFFSALLVLLLFLSATLQIEGTLLVIPMFSAGILSLLIALIYFILDINLSLRALHREIDMTSGGSQ